jgi:putative ABC transport system permease protein
LATDFNIIIKALKYRKIQLEDMTAVAEGCTACAEVGASASTSVRARVDNKELQDVSLYGQTASMEPIDTRTVAFGRYFTPSEAEHRANVCLIGQTVARELFLGLDPLGRLVRIGNEEFMVIGVMEKIGSVLGQDQDNFVIIPLPVFLLIQGIHSSLTINVKTSTRNFEAAQDQAQLILRSRRHLKDSVMGYQKMAPDPKRLIEDSTSPTRSKSYGNGPRFEPTTAIWERKASVVTSGD